VGCYPGSFLPEGVVFLLSVRVCVDAEACSGWQDVVYARDRVGFSPCFFNACFG